MLYIFLMLSLKEFTEGFFVIISQKYLVCSRSLQKNAIKLQKNVEKKGIINLKIDTLEFKWEFFLWYVQYKRTALWIFCDYWGQIEVDFCSSYDTMCRTWWEIACKGNKAITLNCYQWKRTCIHFLHASIMQVTTTW